MLFDFRHPGCSSARSVGRGSLWCGLEALESRTFLSASLPGAEDALDAGVIAATVAAPSPAAEVASANWIVSLGSDADADLVAAMDFSSLGLSAAPRLESLGGSGLYRLTTGEAVARSAITPLLAAAPSFRYVESDQKVFVDVVPDDTSMGVLYALNNTGQSGGTLDADIDAPEAWDITTGSNSIVVAVLDTGIDLTHPDLAANIWTNPGEIPGDGIDNDANGFIDDAHGWDFKNNDNNPTDDQHHGTHVSGTLAAIGNNNNGIAGVAWNVKILPLKFLGSDGLGVASDAVEALNYVANLKQHGVNILVTNNSWGGDENTQALYDAIKAQRDLGILFVAAAGNLNQDSDATPYFPASYDLANIISVASTDRNDVKSTFSNWGPVGTDLAAPGSSIYSTSPVSSYRTLSGTSMGTPLVAGVAALAYSAKPTATWQEVKSAILGSVDPIPSYAGLTVTGGRLNARATLETILGLPNLPPTVATLTSSISSLNAGDPLTLTATGAQDPDGIASKVEFYRDTNNNGVLDVSTDTLLGSDSVGSDGWTVNVNTTGLAAGTHTFFARSVDEHNLGGSAVSTVVTVATPGSEAAYLQDDGADGLVVFEAEGFDVTTSAGGSSWSEVADLSYADGMAMKASPNTGRNVSSNIAALSPRLSFNVNFNRTGTHYIWVRGEGASTSDDSVHAALDGMVQAGSDNLSGFKKLGWYHTSGGVAAVLNVTTTGLHTVELYMREDGFVADKILLTSNGSYSPSGDGPAVSVRTAPPPPTTNLPPTVGGFTVNPNPATVGDLLTLTATGAGDPDGTVSAVQFYRDANSNGQLDPLADALVGSDNAGSDGWSYMVDTAEMAEGAYTYFARAIDNHGLAGAALSAASTINAALPTGDQAYVQDSGADGLVVIEAEAFDARVDRGGSAWSPVNSASYSGGVAMQAAPNTGRNVNTSIASTSPSLSFNVSFNRTGTHYLWIRGAGSSLNDDSVHAALDGVVQAGSDNISGFKSSPGWRHTSGGVAAVLNITTTGPHTVELYMREDGFVADKVLLTSSATYTPTGEGPAPSPRAGTGGNQAPTVGGLAVTPNPATAGDALTLTAANVTDPDGTIVRVDFYRDNGDGVLNISSDSLIGSDTNGGDGWSATASTVGLAGGNYLYFARAQDDQSAAGIASASHAIQSAGGPPAYQESAGQVVIEAEVFDAVTSRSGATWASASSANYSGGLGMQAFPNSGLNIHTNITTTSPQINYRVNFTTVGTYYIWLRGGGASVRDDSVHLGIDGTVPSTSDNISGFSDALAWSRGSTPASISVTTPGLHTVSLYMREDGFTVDKLVLTTDAGFTPTGSGPDASPRAGTASIEASEADGRMTASDRFWAALAALQARRKEAAWWD